MSWSCFRTITWGLPGLLYRWWQSPWGLRTRSAMWGYTAGRPLIVLRDGTYKKHSYLVLSKQTHGVRFTVLYIACLLHSPCNYVPWDSCVEKRWTQKICFSLPNNYERKVAEGGKISKMSRRWEESSLWIHILSLLCTNQALDYFWAPDITVHML